PLRRRRARHIGADDLEEIAARGWPAIEYAPLGQWQLRASNGFSKRANSAGAFGDPGCPVPEALERVRDYYHSRSLPALVQVVADSTMEARIQDAGWV